MWGVVVARRARQALLLSACLCTAAGATAAACLWHLRRSRLYVKRVLRFWWSLGPITAHYRWVAHFAKDATEREERLQRLHQRYAPVVRQVIGELRGMYVKVAQVMSVVPNFLPEEYKREFQGLQNDAPEASWAAICSVVEEDLGAPMAQLFERVERQPLGSASLGQAHLVHWHGRLAVIKVQYPEAAAALRADFDCGEVLTRMNDSSLLPMVQKLRRQFELELDYSQEAWHLRTLHDSIEAAPEFCGRIAVPAPIPELTKGRVLAMDYLPGPKLDYVLTARLRALGIEIGGTVSSIVARATSRPEDQQQAQGGCAQGGSTALSAAPAPDASSGGDSATSQYPGLAARVPSANRKLPPPAPSWRLRAVGVVAHVLGPQRSLWVMGLLAELRLRCLRRRGKLVQGGSTQELHATLQLLLSVHGYQLFFCPCFNGDPHPGNILAVPDGRVGLIDLGQCVTFAPKVKAGFAHLIEALTLPQSQESDALIAQILWRMGVRSQHTDSVFLAFICRFMLTGLRPEWFHDNYLWKVLARDRIIEQPIEVAFISRVANLLRGFGLLLMENVDVARAWHPWAKRWLQENCGANDVVDFSSSE